MLSDKLTQMTKTRVNKECWPNNGFKKANDTHPKTGCLTNEINCSTDEAHSIQATTGIRTI